MDKKTLKRQVLRYITLLSNLKKPPVQLIEDMQYFAGLVDTANESELPEMIDQWQQIKPTDNNSVAYIEGATQ